MIVKSLGIKALAAVTAVGCWFGAQQKPSARCESTAKTEHLRPKVYPKFETGIVEKFLTSQKRKNEKLQLAQNAIETQRWLAAGADANTRDESGWTPLHSARTPTQTKTLIKAGADVNARNKRGWTPLEVAFNAQQVKALFYAGANSMRFSVINEHTFYNQVEKNCKDIKNILSLDEPFKYCSEDTKQLFHDYEKKHMQKSE